MSFGLLSFSLSTHLCPLFFQVLKQLDQELATHNLEKSRLVHVRIHCAPRQQSEQLLLQDPLPPREATAAIVARWNHYISDSPMMKYHIPVVDLLLQRLMRPGALVGVEAIAATYDDERNEEAQAPA